MDSLELWETSVRHDRLSPLIVVRMLPVLLASFSGPLFGSGYLTIFGYVQEEFGVSLLLIGLSISLYAIPFTVGQLFSAGLADLTNRRVMLRIGALSFAVGSLIDAISGNYVLFLVGRVIQGASVAILMPIVLSSLADSVVDAIRGKVIGLYGTTTALGVFLGPILAGTVNAIAGWRAYFVIAASYGLLEFLFLFFGDIRESSLDKEGNLIKKLKKSALETIAIGNDLSMVVVSVLGLFGFMYLIALVTFTSKGLQLLDVPSERIGLVVSAFGLAGILFASPGGWVADKIRRKKTVMLGSMGLVLTAAVAALYMATVDVPEPMILASFMFAFGMMIAFYWAGLNTLATEIIPEKRGASTSFYSFFRNMGQVLAPVVFESPFRIWGLLSLHVIGIVLFMSAFVMLVMTREKS